MKTLIALWAALVAGTASADAGPAPVVVDPDGATLTLAAGHPSLAKWLMPKAMPAPADNATTPQRVALGDLQVFGDRAHLRQHEFRRRHQHLGDALRVLRGERGDDARAIDSERREGLEVGLDAGAARGVGAGDGERDGCHTLVYFIPASAGMTMEPQPMLARPGKVWRIQPEM